MSKNSHCEAGRCRLITESPLNVVATVVKKGNLRDFQFFKKINNRETDRVSVESTGVRGDKKRDVFTENVFFLN